MLLLLFIVGAQNRKKTLQIGHQHDESQGCRFSFIFMYHVYGLLYFVFYGYRTAAVQHYHEYVSMYYMINIPVPTHGTTPQQKRAIFEKRKTRHAEREHPMNIRVYLPQTHTHSLFTTIITTQTMQMYGHVYQHFTYSNSSRNKEIPMGSQLSINGHPGSFFKKTFGVGARYSRAAYVNKKTRRRENQQGCFLLRMNSLRNSLLTTVPEIPLCKKTIVPTAQGLNYRMRFVPHCCAVFRWATPLSRSLLSLAAKNDTHHDDGPFLLMEDMFLASSMSLSKEESFSLSVDASGVVAGSSPLSSPDEPVPL